MAFYQENWCWIIFVLTQFFLLLLFILMFISSLSLLHPCDIFIFPTINSFKMPRFLPHNLEDNYKKLSFQAKKDRFSHSNFHSFEYFNNSRNVTERLNEQVIKQVLGNCGVERMEFTKKSKHQIHFNIFCNKFVLK